MNNLTDDQFELLESYCNETISDDDFKKLEKMLLEDDDFRKEARAYFSMDSFLNMDREDMPIPFELPKDELVKQPLKQTKNYFWPLALAASISFIAGIMILPLFKSETDQEITASGFAVIDKIIDVEWSNGSKAFKDKDAVANEKIKLEKGIVHLEFFCGASVIIEGPAEFDVNSSWEGFVHKGKLTG